MKTLIHRSGSRGHANHGWLDSKHSFSFANYYNPEKMHFGVLRVLNDDKIAPGTGFGEHPHENMEIISIPLSGALKHKDSIGNSGTIEEGEIQVMSAGTGIVHSEMNASSSKECKFLQIWIIPNQQGITPRYGQQRISQYEKKDEWNLLVGPETNQNGLWIQQNAYLSLSNFSRGTTSNYELNNDHNGVYFFVISGEVEIENNTLTSRDAIGVWDTTNVDIMIKEDTRLLAIEVPMQW